MRAGRRRRPRAGEFERVGPALVVLDLGLAGPRRPRGHAPAASRERRPHPHADRALERGRQGAGARGGRRRLPHQAVQHLGAGGARARAAATHERPASSGDSSSAALRIDPARRGASATAIASRSPRSSSTCSTSSPRGPASVFSREALMEHVWGNDRVVGRALDRQPGVAAAPQARGRPRRLRAYLQTVWGAGYRFDGADVSGPRGGPQPVLDVHRRVPARAVVGDGARRRLVSVHGAASARDARARERAELAVARVATAFAAVAAPPTPAPSWTRCCAARARQHGDPSRVLCALGRTDRR